MEVKARSFALDSTDPFAGDLLDRQTEIKNLTTLLQNISTPLVLSVNGRWGTGKSTFINMWSSYLESEGFHVLNFNAWTTDFSEDPLVAFLGEMNANLEDHLEESGQLNESWERCKKLGGLIAQRSIPVALRLATAGLITGSELAESEGMSLAGNLAEDAVKAFQITKSKIVEFKALLAKVLAERRSEFPLVIFVDELDRCRPTYAIELLERIKHLFDQKGIVFVLAMDREQLCHSIGAVYGGIDAAGYLRRFIDLEYSLRMPSKDSYVKNLFAVFGIQSFFDNRSALVEREQLFKVFLRLMDLFDFGLREIEQLASRMRLALLTTPGHKSAAAPLLLFLLVVKERHTDLYADMERRSDWSSVAIEFLKKFRINHASEDSEISLNMPLALIEGNILSVSFDVPDSKRRYKEHRAVLEKESVSRSERSYSDTVVYQQQAGVPSVIKEILSRIELVSEFQFPQGSVDD